MTNDTTVNPDNGTSEGPPAAVATAAIDCLTGPSTGTPSQLSIPLMDPHCPTRGHDTLVKMLDPTPVAWQSGAGGRTKSAPVEPVLQRVPRPVPGAGVGTGPGTLRSFTQCHSRLVFKVSPAADQVMCPAEHPPHLPIPLPKVEAKPAVACHCILWLYSTACSAVSSTAGSASFPSCLLYQETAYRSLQ